MLVAILASPPLTSGLRSRSRVDLAARLLGFDTAAIANLIAEPTSDVGDLARVGATAAPWRDSRRLVRGTLLDASAVILGWGTTEPLGAARLHHRDQVSWLLSEIAGRRLETWTVGGTPRHPSRWQRYTWRTHPELPFENALKASLTRGDLAKPARRV